MFQVRQAARTEDWNPILFILYGPASRVVISFLLCVALFRYGTGVQDSVDKKHWTVWTIAFALIAPIVALVAFSPIGTNFYVRAGMEALSITMYLVAIAVIIFRKINTQLMFLYLISLIFFIQSSVAFILVQMAWNHMFWLAHIFFAAGFFIINCGLLRSYQTSTSFSEVFDAEEALREREEQFRAVINSSPSAITLKDRDGRYLLINKTYGTWMNTDPAVLVGKIAHDYFPQEQADEIEASDRKVLKTGENITTEGVRSFNDGLTRSVIASKAPVYDSNEKVIAVSSVITDITERKQAEAALKVAKDDADHANQAKSKFLASMSHELRTPMNAVLGFAQMLQYNPKEPLSAAQTEQVESILQGGNHLLGLVNEILDLAQVEANKIKISIGEVDAKEVVADCVNLMTPVGEPRGIKIINQFSSEPSVLIFTDHTRIKQVLINLLSNAVKYNKDGGTVTIEGRESVSGFLRISVADTGEGIAEEDFSSVFQPFHRLNANPAIAREGTGIGLTVTKSLVEMMAGRIGFDSEVGVGSTFWIDLPLASNEDVLIWTDAIKTGVDAIDKDHQVLLSLLNRLARRSADEADVDDVINELIEYTQYHFSREEALMQVCGYPAIESHREHHRTLIDDLNQHFDAWRSERNQESLNQFRKFLKDWLFNHILREDTKITNSANGKDRDIRKKLADLGLTR